LVCVCGDGKSDHPGLLLEKQWRAAIPLLFVKVEFLHSLNIAHIFP